MSFSRKATPRLKAIEESKEEVNDDDEKLEDIQFEDPFDDEFEEEEII